MTNYYTRYHQTIDRIGSSRQRDAHEIARVTALLRRAETSVQILAAIEETRSLWTRCGVTTYHDTEQLPNALRRTMTVLSRQMIAACDRAEQGDHKALRLLIDTNLMILSGLGADRRPVPQGGPLFHPRVLQVA